MFLIHGAILIKQDLEPKRCIYDAGEQGATEFVINLSAMAPAMEQGVLCAKFLKPGACYEMKEVSNNGFNRENFPGLSGAAILGREITDLGREIAVIPESEYAEEGPKQVLETMKAKRNAARKMGTTFEAAVEYVDNVRQTVTMMNANGFKLIVDDQHATEQPVFWLPQHELAQIHVYMVKFGFVRVLQLIADSRSKNFGALSAAAEEVSVYKPAKVCFEGSFNQETRGDVRYGPQAGIPFAKMMQAVTALIDHDRDEPIAVCMQGGWKVPDVPDELKGQAAAQNTGGGVHVGTFAAKVQRGQRRADLLPFALPSEIAQEFQPPVRV